MNLFKKKQSVITKPHELGYTPKIKILNITSILIILISISATGWFVYANIYQTIGKVQTLLTIEQKPQFEPINFKLYKETQENWDKKYNSKLPEIKRNPFKKIEIATSTSSTIEIIDE